MFNIKNREIASVEFRSKDSIGAVMKFNQVSYMEMSEDEFLLSLPGVIQRVNLEEIRGFTVHYRNGDVLEYNREM